MKFNCPNCGIGYKIDPARLPDKGAYTRCKKCKHRFLVSPPATSGKSIEPSRQAAGAADTPKENTSLKTPPESVAIDSVAGIDDSPELKQVDQYVADGNPEAAASLMLDVISRYARGRDFSKAELLRDKFYDVAPMALNEIVNANEIIEEEKGKSIDARHLELWADLYDTLESDEVSELYFAMQPVSIKAGQPLFEKGTIDSNLYFLQQGRVNMIHWDNTRDREVVLKAYAPGEILNKDAFFSFTVTTSTVIAAQDSELTYLEKDRLDNWEENFAGLGPKLNSYCRNRDNIYELAKKVGIELRTYPRFLTSLSALIQYIDPSGKPQKKPFKVSLFDIAAGGTSFELRLTRKADAAQLLGQHIVIQTVYTIEKKKRKVLQKGRVIAAHLQPFGLSAIHIQFNEPLSDETMEEIEKASSQSDEMI